MLPLFDETFLRSQWDAEFQSFRDSPEARALLARLRAWAGRDLLNERASETAFIQRFFAHALLQPGAGFEVGEGDGEIVLRIGGREAVRLYDRPDTPFIAAQWRHALRDQRVTEAFDAKWLQRLLLDLRATADAGLRDRLLALDAEISALDATLAERESALNALIYRLYGLAAEEITMVEEG